MLLFCLLSGFCNVLVIGIPCWRRVLFHVFGGIEGMAYTKPADELTTFLFGIRWLMYDP